VTDKGKDAQVSPPAVALITRAVSGGWFELMVLTGSELLAHYSFPVCWG